MTGSRRYSRQSDNCVKSPLQSWKQERRGRTSKAKPDEAWEKYALPIGNGFVEAMIYEGVAVERIQFNEHSLWTGGPGSPRWSPDLTLHEARKHLPEMRHALPGGDTRKARQLRLEDFSPPYKVA